MHYYYEKCRYENCRNQIRCKGTTKNRHIQVLCRFFVSNSQIPSFFHANQAYRAVHKVRAREEQ